VSTSRANVSRSGTLYATWWQTTTSAGATRLATSGHRPATIVGVRPSPAACCFNSSSIASLVSTAVRAVICSACGRLAAPAPAPRPAPRPPADPAPGGGGPPGPPPVGETGGPRHAVACPPDEDTGRKVPGRVGHRGQDAIGDGPGGQLVLPVPQRGPDDARHR